MLRECASAALVSLRLALSGNSPRAVRSAFRRHTIAALTRPRLRLLGAALADAQTRRTAPMPDGWGSWSRKLVSGAPETGPRVPSFVITSGRPRPAVPPAPVAGAAGGGAVF